jgi:RND family efflux transporter MFP subunit
MASEPERRSGGPRQDLAALRIDRSATPPPPSRRGLWIALALSAVAGIGLGAWLWLGRAPEVSVAYAQRSASTQAAPAAEVLTGSGYVVTADRYISLGVRVSSRILSYLVEEGQQVQAGQPLVQLDARQYEATLAQTRAELARARANINLYRRELERARELHARNVASDADLDVKQNQLRVGEAEVARLQAQVQRQEVDLEDTVVRAPTAGVILEKFKEVGEIAVPGGFQGSGELIRMANLDDLRAELDVNESDLSRIALDQPARVVPEAYPDRSYDARVVKLYPQINRQKGTLKVEVKILQPDSWLRPDMSARVTFLAPPSTTVREEGAEAPAVVLAPPSAVRSDAGGSFAWVVTEGRVRRQALVSAGNGPGGQILVTSGLAGGEALVIRESAPLVEGQRVEIAAAN